MKCIYWRKFALSLLVLVILYSFPKMCTSHLNEDPEYKYSREGNERTVHAENDHKHEMHGHSHFHHEDNLKNINKNMSEIWLHSLGSTLFISAVPFFLLFVIPLDSSDEMKPRLKVLLAFASGGLLGDAFLHLIPHATHPHHSQLQSQTSLRGHSHSHDHSKDTEIGLWVLFGIIVFLVVEKLMRMLKGDENINRDHKKENIEKSEKSAKTCEKNEHKAENVQISGYLNLAADFAHNFTDGLAIGASYLAGNSIGIVTTVTILLHEVPHEIGDFAILIKSGCTRRKAMYLQLVTAVGALSGNALALIGVGTDVDAAPWVLPFTAGGFIYIATVSVLPELLEGSTKLGQSVKEISALLLGVILMTFIAIFE